MIKKVKKRFKKYKDAKSVFKTLRSPNKSQYLPLKLNKDEELLYEAQKLHAQVYLSRNFIVTEDLNKKGVMHSKADPHQHHAVYFSVIDKDSYKVVGTSRQIEHNREKDFHSFPLLQKAKIDKKWLEYIENHRPESVIEISGLAKKRNASSIIPLYLYRQMWHHSIEAGHELWLMACDVRLFQRLKVILGEAITQVGKETEYTGGNVIPAIVQPKQALEALIDSTDKSKRLKKYTRLLVLEFFLEGLSNKYLSASEMRKLKKLGIEIPK